MTLRAAGLAYREAHPENGRGLSSVLCVHGFPESSYMWRDLLPAVAESGLRAIAPDLPGYGDTPPDPPGTWERHVEALGRFADELELDRVVLVLHDWGGLIGLRWACENRDRIAGLVLSNTGFFADGKWHGFAKMLRTPGQGEEIANTMTPELMAATLRAQCDAFDDETIAEYVKCVTSPDARQGMLDLYRSGDFEKIAAYGGCLEAMDVPAIALWGENDEFAPIAGGYRFKKALPDCEVVHVDAGHFLYAEAPERCATEVTAFLRRLA
jgi:haloalkane dehalogenase